MKLTQTMTCALGLHTLGTKGINLCSGLTMNTFSRCDQYCKGTILIKKLYMIKMRLTQYTRLAVFHDCGKNDTIMIF